MPHFDIVKKSAIGQSYRVSRIMGDFDVKEEHCAEHFVGDIELPEKWNVGLIVGKSGTGKTTIAQDVFGDNLFAGGSYTGAPLIDDMPKDASVDQIEKAFYSVGLGSVPDWLKRLFHVPTTRTPV